jgi:adenosylmethionine-8-amino-7-oxononanoate aminotransferase
LTLLEQNSDQFMGMESRHRAFAEQLHDIEHISNLRFCGTIAAADLTTSDGNNYFDAVGPALRKYMLSRGYLIRPLGNTIYLMPPYCISDEELSGAYRVIAEAVREVVG